MNTIKLPFKKIDAFAASNSDGNPAGYIMLGSMRDLTDLEMLRIAKELKGFVNEVGFVSRISNEAFSLRFYSSECEVDFCGHATIAIMYDLIKNDTRLHHISQITIETRRGNLAVVNKLATEDAIYIMAPVPFDVPLTANATEIAAALSLSPGEISHSHKIAHVNAGLSTLIVPIISLDSILRIAPDLEKLKGFCLTSGTDIVEVFTPETVSPISDFRVRVFAPRFGYLEDPATGSGNSAFGYYLLQNNLFGSETITIEQNQHRNHCNFIKLRKETDTNGSIRILFGGGAITRIEGSFFLHQ